jgi:hypothetical protein
MTTSFMVRKNITQGSQRQAPICPVIQTRSTTPKTRSTTIPQKPAQSLKPQSSAVSLRQLFYTEPIKPKPVVNAYQTKEQISQERSNSVSQSSRMEKCHKEIVSQLQYRSQRTQQAPSNLLSKARNLLFTQDGSLSHKILKSKSKRRRQIADKSEEPPMRSEEQQ